MLPSEKEKLFTRDSEFISVGISEEGRSYGSYMIPWSTTANAYKMKTPKVYLSKEDLNNPEIMDKLATFKVQGCYVYCELENYDFLKRFPDITDLTIHQATHLKDLSFLETLTNCRLLFLSKAHLPHIDQVIGKNAQARPQCVALYDCVVEDISRLKEQNVFFNELVIFNPKNRDERERWAGLHRLLYYNMREK